MPRLIPRKLPPNAVPMVQLGRLRSSWGLLKFRRPGLFPASFLILAVAAIPIHKSYQTTPLYMEVRIYSALGAGSACQTARGLRGEGLGGLSQSGLAPNQDGLLDPITP